MPSRRAAASPSPAAPPAEAADTRTRIVETAAELFYRRGYGVVGVQDVCAAAGVSKSSLYHFFPTKEDIALAVLDRRWEGFRAMTEPLAAQGLPPLQRLAAVLEGMHQISRQTHEAWGAVRGCPFGSLGSELSDAAPAVRDRVARVFDDMGAMFEAWLREAQGQGALAPGADSAAMAQDLVAAVQASSVVGRVYNDPARVQSIGTRLLAAILGPAATPPGSSPTRRQAPR